MKKSIVIFHPNLVGGGAERIVSYLVNNLNRSKYDLTLALCEVSGEYLDSIKEDVNIVSLNIKKFRLSAIIKLYNFIRNVKPDIFYSSFSRYNAGVAMISMFLPKKCKVVIRETGVPGTKGFHIKKYIVLIYRAFINNCDAIIAQSNDMKEGIINYFYGKQKKIHVINNPVDVRYIQSKLKLETNFKLKENTINLLSIGRFSNTKQKGFDLLIKTFSQFKNIHKYHLHLLGQGEILDEMKQLARKLNIADHISFWGFQPNPFKFIAACDVYISSSRYEGFPNAVVESLACGTPVLANNYKGGINEIIEPGINGYICDITKPDECQHYIAQILEKCDNKKAIITAVETKWNIQKQILEFEKLFDSL